MQGMAPCPCPCPSSEPPFHAPFNRKPFSKNEIEMSLITDRLVWTSRMPEPEFGWPVPSLPAPSNLNLDSRQLLVLSKSFLSKFSQNKCPQNICNLLVQPMIRRGQDRGRVARSVGCGKNDFFFLECFFRAAKIVLEMTDQLREFGPGALQDGGIGQLDGLGDLFFCSTL